MAQRLCAQTALAEDRGSVPSATPGGSQLLLTLAPGTQHPLLASTGDHTHVPMLNGAGSVARLVDC